MRRRRSSTRWFLLQQFLSRNAPDLLAVRCRHCDSQYLRDRVNPRHMSPRVPGVRVEEATQVWNDADTIACMALPRSHPNMLAGPYLERAAHWRKDEERLRAALDDPATWFVPVWHARSAVVTSSDGRASAYFAAGAQTFAGLDASGFILLGEFQEQSCSRSRSPAKLRRRSRAARRCTICG